MNLTTPLALSLVLLTACGDKDTGSDVTDMARMAPACTTGSVAPSCSSSTSTPAARPSTSNAVVDGGISDYSAFASTGPDRLREHLASHPHHQQERIRRLQPASALVAMARHQVE
ncbi:MAG: hypothetical protein ACI8RZ_003709 [Myxococcota bacterium]|jgi:hypothetical protein